MTGMNQQKPGWMFLAAHSSAKLGKENLTGSNAELRWVNVLHRHPGRKPGGGVIFADKSMSLFR